MDLLDANGYLLVAITILASIGIALFFFGSLFTMAAAFGRGDKVFGIAIIMVLPLSIVYCLMHREYTRYPSKYLLTGMLLFALAAICLLLL